MYILKSEVSFNPSLGITNFYFKLGHLRTNLKSRQVGYLPELSGKWLEIQIRIYIFIFELEMLETLLINPMAWNLRTLNF